jgi:ApbE superfamily uncharacterized protein (UPF0280 family)
VCGPGAIEFDRSVEPGAADAAAMEAAQDESVEHARAAYLAGLEFGDDDIKEVEEEEEDADGDVSLD